MPTPRFPALRGVPVFFQNFWFVLTSKDLWRELAIFFAKILIILFLPLVWVWLYLRELGGEEKWRREGLMDLNYWIHRSEFFGLLAFFSCLVWVLSLLLACAIWIAN